MYCGISILYIVLCYNFLIVYLHLSLSLFLKSLMKIKALRRFERETLVIKVSTFNRPELEMKPRPET